MVGSVVAPIEKIDNKYFHHEQQGSLQAAIAAWNEVKSCSGPNTYEFYISLKGGSGRLSDIKFDD